jgi:myosin heavy subunit
MKNRVPKNRLPFRVWLRELKLNARGLWLRLFPRKTLEKKINWLREQNEDLQTNNNMLRNQVLQLLADIRKLNEELLKERTQNAEICLQLDRHNKQLMAENRELKKQLAKKISELEKTDSWNVELNKDKTRLIDESNTLNDQCLRLAAQVQRLTASVQELERERERWVNKTQAHRDARRIICAELNKLGQIDSYAEKQPPPTAPPPERISYRTPTVEDLMQGPFPVEVSKDGQNWYDYFLVEIIDDSNPYVCTRTNNQSAPPWYFRFARVLDTGTKPNA